MLYTSATVKRNSNMEREIDEPWKKVKRHPEGDQPLADENDSAGYSEKELDTRVDIQVGKWHDLKQSPAQQKKNDKVSELYKTVSDRLTKVMSEYYRVISSDSEFAVVLLHKAHQLRLAQDTLFTFMTENKYRNSDKELEKMKSSLPREILEMVEK